MEVSDRPTVVRYPKGAIAADLPAVRSDAAGDTIVGVKGRKAATLVELYRLIRAQGDAGTAIGLDVMQGGDVRRIDVVSVNRLDYLKLKTTF